MKKRILALSLFILMSLCIIASAPVSAAGCRMTLVVDQVSAPAEPGTEVRVPIMCPSNTGYCSAVLAVQWDNTALELKDVVFTDLAPDQTSPPVSNSGTYTMRVGNSLSATNFTGTGVFLTLVFRVGADTAPGRYTVSIVHTDILDTDLYDVAVSVVPGEVILTSPSGDGIEQVPAESLTLPPEKIIESTGKDAMTAASATEAPATEAPATAAPTAVQPDAEASPQGNSAGLWIALAIGVIAVIGGGAAFFFIKKSKAQK